MISNKNMANAYAFAELSSSNKTKITVSPSVKVTGTS